MGRPREHDETTRRALLVAAERLIDEEGPEAASVRAVAEEVGTTTRAVYSLFGSKQGLLEALAIRLFEVLIDAIDGVPLSDDPAEDVIEASLRAFRGTALEHPSLYRLVFLRLVPDLELGPAFITVATESFGRLEALVARLHDAGRLGSWSVHDAAVAVHALTEGLATVELRGVMLEPASAERAWRASIGALVAGFAT